MTHTGSFPYVFLSGRGKGHMYELRDTLIISIMVITYNACVKHHTVGLKCL